MVDEKKIQAEREHQKLEALKAQGEVVERLRIMEVLAEPSESDKLDRAHHAAFQLALVINGAFGSAVEKSTPKNGTGVSATDDLASRAGILPIPVLKLM